MSNIDNDYIMEAADIVHCDKCGADGNAPCMTAGGNIAMDPHACRKRRGYTLEMQLKHVPPDQLAYSAGKRPSTPEEAIKLGLWFINTAGGIEQAERALSAARAALNSFQQSVNH